MDGAEGRILIRKSTMSRQAAAPARRSGAGPSSWVRADSGGGLESDPVAEGLELADVVALGALSVDASVVEAGAQVLEPCGRVGQQMPDDDQDGPATATMARLLPRRRAIRR